MIRARFLYPVLFLVSAAALALPCNTLKAPGFARINLIPGDATDPCHRNEIQLLAPVTLGGSTGTLVKAQDVATPALILAAAIGKHIQEVKITTFNPSNMSMIVTHTLQDVLVKAVDIRTGGVNREEVTFSFASIKTDQEPGSVTGTASVAVGALASQMAVMQGPTPSSWTSLSTYRFTVRNNGGKADVSVVVNPTHPELSDNANIQVKTGRLTWAFTGVRSTAAPLRTLTRGERLFPRGETTLQVSTFRISVPPTGDRPAGEFGWDLTQNKKV